MDVRVDEARQRRRVGVGVLARVLGMRHRRVGPDGDDPTVLDKQSLIGRDRGTVAVDEVADGEPDGVHGQPV